MKSTYQTENERRIALILAGRRKPMSVHDIMEIPEQCGHQMSDEELRRALLEGPFNRNDNGWSLGDK